jgi:hypothetical protein
MLRQPEQVLVDILVVAAAVVVVVETVAEAVERAQAI